MEPAGRFLKPGEIAAVLVSVSRQERLQVPLPFLLPLFDLVGQENVQSFLGFPG